MIFPNIITGPNSQLPLSLPLVAKGTLALPVRLRPRLMHILPRRVQPTGVMTFDYPTQMAVNGDEQAEIAAAKLAGTVMDYYLGAKALPSAPAERRKVLERHRGCGRLIFDQVADDAADSPEAALIRQVLAIGMDVGVEANKKQDWIVALMDKYGPRITVCAHWWLWENVRGRFTTDEVKALGGKPLVLVRDASSDNDEQNWWDARPTEFNQFKVDKATEWAPYSDVTIRLGTMQPAQLTTLEAANA